MILEAIRYLEETAAWVRQRGKDVGSDKCAWDMFGETAANYEATVEKLREIMMSERWFVSYSYRPMIFHPDGTAKGTIDPVDAFAIWDRHPAKVVAQRMLEANGFDSTPPETSTQVDLIERIYLATWMADSERLSAAEEEAFR